MKLAVLTYEFVASPPEGIPVEWPAEVREISDVDPSPGPDWLIMTKTEYDSYISERIDDYNAWASIFYSPSAVEERAALVLKDMEFGRNIIATFVAKNMVENIPMATRIELLQDPNLRDIHLSLLTGGLDVALELIENTLPTLIITQEIIDEFGAMIRSHLGL